MPDGEPTQQELAVDRTLLANERTLLAYVRTSLTLVVTGLTFLKFFWNDALYVTFAFAALVAGAIFLVVGGVRFFQMHRAYTRERR